MAGLEGGGGASGELPLFELRVPSTVTSSLGEESVTLLFEFAFCADFWETLWRLWALMVPGGVWLFFVGRVGANMERPTFLDQRSHHR